MNNVAPVITAIIGILGLASLGGATWAVIRTSAQEASNKRLRTENEDYLRRLNYLEPRVDVLERENKTLRGLRDPTEALDNLATQEQRNHDQSIAVLTRIETHLAGESR